MSDLGEIVVPRVTIRAEQPADVGAISAVEQAAFIGHPLSRQTEHLIVDALREAGALALSLVAEYDGRIVGHVGFSAARVGEVAGWMLLGPVAVEPALQRQGIGSALVRSGLGAIRADATLGCVLIGDACFYARFGFRPWPGLTYAGVPGEHVLGLPFADAAPRGEICVHAAFDVGA